MQNLSSRTRDHLAFKFLLRKVGQLLRFVSRGSKSFEMEHKICQETPQTVLKKKKILDKKASLRVVSYTLYIASRPHMKLVI